MSRWRCTVCGEEYAEEVQAVDCHGRSGDRDSWCDGLQEEVTDDGNSAGT